jgi:hypothetical protein
MTITALGVSAWSALRKAKPRLNQKEREIMSKPTPEYYQAKADLCERLAIQQIWSGNTDMGMKNLMRMTYALAEIQLQEKEGEDE